MPNQRYESTLNTWLAEALTAQGLDARPENAQGGGKRLDVELRVDDLKIALEAERGLSAGKRAEAIKDADSRLRDELADCAIAICYPAGLGTRAELDACALLYTLRTKGSAPPPAKTDWKQGGLPDLLRRGLAAAPLSQSAGNGAMYAIQSCYVPGLQAANLA